MGRQTKQAVSIYIYIYIYSSVSRVMYMRGTYGIHGHVAEQGQLPSIFVSDV
jgi:hypothetical protein